MTSKLSSAVTHVTGLPYHDAPALLKELRNGSVVPTGKYSLQYLPIVLVPEPQNPKNPQAIRVDVPGAVLSDGQTRKLGYIPDAYVVEWHTYFGRSPKKTGPLLSASVDLSPEDLEAVQGILWSIKAFSPHSILPQQQDMPPRPHHDFQLQKDVFANIGKGLRPRRRSRDHHVWI